MLSLELPEIPSTQPTFASFSLSSATALDPNKLLTEPDLDGCTTWSSERACKTSNNAELKHQQRAKYIGIQAVCATTLETCNPLCTANLNKSTLLGTNPVPNVVLYLFLITLSNTASPKTIQFKTVHMATCSIVCWTSKIIQQTYILRSRFYSTSEPEKQVLVMLEGLLQRSTDLNTGFSRINSYLLENRKLLHQLQIPMPRQLTQPWPRPWTHRDFGVAITLVRK